MHFSRAPVIASAVMATMAVRLLPFSARRISLAASYPSISGIWAQIDMRFEYDDENKGKNPFWIDRLTPIQLATFDLEEYRRLRAEFNSDEWLDVVMRSMGYAPEQLSRRVKLLFTLRLKIGR